MTDSEVKSKVRTLMDAKRDSDVLNIEGKSHWWPLSEIPVTVVAYNQIRSVQKKVFYDRILRPTASYMDTHTTQVFDKLFSEEPPAAAWFDTEKYITESIKSGNRLSLIRYSVPLKAPDGSMKLLCDIPEYVSAIKNSAQSLIGAKYDIGQLVMIKFNEWWGDDWDYKQRWLDFGKNRHVCSVAVRMNFEDFRKKNPNSGMVRLFDKMDRDYWSGDEFSKFDGVDVEMTYPACFSNSKFFCSEFKLVARV